MTGRSIAGFIQGDGGYIAAAIGGEGFDAARTQPDQHDIMLDGHQVADARGDTLEVHIKLDRLGLQQGRVKPEPTQPPDNLRVRDAGQLQLLVEGGGDCTFDLTVFRISICKDEHFVFAIALLAIGKVDPQGVDVAWKGFANPETAR